MIQKINLTISVDFDGTVVSHEYPKVGDEVPHAVRVLKKLAKDHDLIIYTMRSGIELMHAVAWFEERGIPYKSANYNEDQKAWTDSPKIYADIYIGDDAEGCPLISMTGKSRPVVDWAKIEDSLIEKGVTRPDFPIYECDSCGWYGMNTSMEAWKGRRGIEIIRRCKKCDNNELGYSLPPVAPSDNVQMVFKCIKESPGIFELGQTYIELFDMPGHLYPDDESWIKDNCYLDRPRAINLECLDEFDKHLVKKLSISPESTSWYPYRIKYFHKRREEIMEVRSELADELHSINSWL